MEVYGFVNSSIKKEGLVLNFISFLSEKGGGLLLFNLRFMDTGIAFHWKQHCCFPYIDVTTLSWMCFPCPKWIIKDKGNHLEGHVLTIA